MKISSGVSTSVRACVYTGSGGDATPTPADVAAAAARSAGGSEDVEDASWHWVTIQRNTFANWVLEQLGERAVELGLRGGGAVDLQHDLVDGRLLCVLVEVLQQQRQRLTVNAVVRRPVNQHQCIDNINRALRAVTDDGIRLVNIGQSVSLLRSGCTIHT